MAENPASVPRLDEFQLESQSGRSQMARVALVGWTFKFSIVRLCEGISFSAVQLVTLSFSDNLQKCFERSTVGIPEHVLRFIQRD